MSRILGLLRPIAILGIAIAIAVVMLKNKPVIEPRQVEIPLPIVDIQQITLDTVPVSVIAHGNVAAGRQLDLTAQVSGQILWQSDAFEPGEIVEQGEPLLRIDPTDYKLALAEAEQSLSSAKLALADAKALRQQARIEEAAASVAAAEARIERAERDLANTEISAPYTAIVDQQAVEEGQFVVLGSQLGRLLGADHAEIRLSVPPQDIAFIDQSADASAIVSRSGTADGLSWAGRVVRVEARLDNQTRVFPVVVDVASPLDTTVHTVPLRFGQFVRVEIPGGRVAGAVILPQAAIHGDDDVFLHRNGKLVRRSVDVARVSEGGVLITGGLDNGDEVVTTRLDLMFEGMAVAPR